MHISYLIAVIHKSAVFTESIMHSLCTKILYKMYTNSIFQYKYCKSIPKSSPVE